MRFPSKAAGILVSLFFSAAAVGAAELSLFEPGSHCVAYKVKKTSFFVSSSEVIGRNCDVSAQVLPEVGGLYHIEVNIPIRSFASGDTERDRDVMKILKADERAELTFRTSARSAAAWRELFAKKNFEMDGQLFIGDKSYPIMIDSRYSEKEDVAEIDGAAKVRFDDFGLRPPKIAGGIVASVKPEFELHYHFVSQRILGADAIRVATEDTATAESPATEATPAGTPEAKPSEKKVKK